MVEVDPAPAGFLRLRPQRAEVDRRGQRQGESNTWTLVGSTEANLAVGKLSAESPIGKALMDTKVGATVEVETPRGVKRAFKVLKLVS